MGTILVIFLFVAICIVAKIAFTAISLRYGRGVKVGYENGYEAGYEAGYHGAAYDLRKSLGKDRFNDLLMDVKFEGARPKSWKDRNEEKPDPQNLTKPEGMIE
jgi:hypothetical protein